MKPIATVHWTDGDADRSASVWTTDGYIRLAGMLDKKKISYVTCWMNVHMPLPCVTHKNDDVGGCLTKVM